MPQFIPITTEIGTLFGRDAIFLDSVSLSDNCNTLELSGEFNCSLASKPPPSPAKWQAYKIQFCGVLAFRVTELDTWESTQGGRWPKTSFDEVTESEWLAQLRSPMSAVKPEHRHFIFQTYDYVFEVICTSYKLDMPGK
jgi:hypothetical protein